MLFTTIISLVRQLNTFFFTTTINLILQLQTSYFYINQDLKKKKKTLIPREKWEVGRGPAPKKKKRTH
jgi:hypothetical protein